MVISLFKWIFLREKLLEYQFLDFELKIQMCQLLALSLKEFVLSHPWSVRNDHSERCHWISYLSLSIPISLSSPARE
jgi:hypothetical protein